MQPQAPPRPVQKKWLVLIGLILGYAGTEVLANLYFLWRPPGAVSFWIYENSERTMQFDAIRGYRLTPTPCRFAHFRYGTVDMMGSFRGNSQGFAGHREFGPQRKTPQTKRVAVFGDSFTAGITIKENWPDRLQRMADERGAPLEVLNFSIDSAGLAQWWSVMTRLVEPEKYDLDAIIFAVYDNDLVRRFYVGGQSGPGPLRFGAVKSWDPAAFPATLEAAQTVIEPNMQGYDVTTEQFERALGGEWHPPAQRRLEFWVAHILGHEIKVIYRQFRRAEAPAIDPATVTFDLGREKLIQDMHRYISSRHLPVVVLYSPGREAMLGIPVQESVSEIKAFARELGADFVDGREAFAGLTREEIIGNLQPHDMHWNDAGSARVAALVARLLAQMKESSGAPLLPASGGPAAPALSQPGSH